MQAGFKDRALNSLVGFREVLETLREGAARRTPTETLEVVIDHLMKDESFDERIWWRQ